MKIESFKRSDGECIAVALQDVRIGELIGTILGNPVDKPDQHTLTIGDQIYELEAPFRNLQHSCNPNAYVSFEGEVVALANIKEGDSVTIDYEKYEDTITHPFKCECGSDVCRGEIPSLNSALKNHYERKALEAKPVQSGVDSTLEERGSRYGKFSGHSDIAQDLKCTLWKAPGWYALNDSQKESLEMIAHKIGRIINEGSDPNYDDTWLDIAGYAQLIVNQLQGVEV